MNLRLPMLAVAALTLSGCVTVTEQYADEGYFSSPNNGYSGGGDNGYFSSDNTYYSDYGQYYYSPYRPTINFSFNFFFGSPYYYGYSPYGSCWYSNCYGYYPYHGGHRPYHPKPPKNDNGPKPPKPPKPGDPIVDRDGPVRPGPGWQPRVRRATATVAPAAALSTVPAAPVNAASVNEYPRSRRARNADQTPLQPQAAIPQQSPRSPGLAREPQARAANLAAPTRAARPQSEARSRPEPAPRPARQERTSKNDDRDP
jgi:hypothetical protein